MRGGGEKVALFSNGNNIMIKKSKREKDVEGNVLFIGRLCESRVVWGRPPRSAVTGHAYRTLYVANARYTRKLTCNEQMYSSHFKYLQYSNN